MIFVCRGSAKFPSSARDGIVPKSGRCATSRFAIAIGPPVGAPERRTEKGKVAATLPAIIASGPTAASKFLTLPLPSSPFRCAVWRANVEASK